VLERPAADGAHVLPSARTSMRAPDERGVDPPIA
jgi:hypothetical protein